MENFIEIFQCPICKNTCVEAVTCISCNNIFCNSCIIQLEKCPTCRIIPFVIEPEISVRRMINLMDYKKLNLPVNTEN